MRKDLLIIALGLLLPAGPVAADVLAVPQEDPAGQPAILLPAKGTTMADVEKKFGQPRAKQGAKVMQHGPDGIGDEVGHAADLSIAGRAPGKPRFVDGEGIRLADPANHSLSLSS